MVATTIETTETNQMVETKAMEGRSLDRSMAERDVTPATKRVISSEIARRR